MSRSDKMYAGHVASIKSGPLKAWVAATIFAMVMGVLKGRINFGEEETAADIVGRGLLLETLERQKCFCLRFCPLLQDLNPESNDVP